jgi:hypothetical protein
MNNHINDIRFRCCLERSLIVIYTFITVIGGSEVCDALVLEAGRRTGAKVICLFALSSAIRELTTDLHLPHLFTGYGPLTHPGTAYNSHSHTSRQRDEDGSSLITSVLVFHNTHISAVQSYAIAPKKV